VYVIRTTPFSLSHLPTYTHPHTHIHTTEEIQRQEEEAKRMPVVLHESTEEEKREIEETKPIVEWDEKGELRILVSGKEGESEKEEGEEKEERR